jgi:hypothetical protein
LTMLKTARTMATTQMPTVTQGRRAQARASDSVQLLVFMPTSSKMTFDLTLRH